MLFNENGFLIDDPIKERIGGHKHKSFVDVVNNLKSGSYEKLLRGVIQTNDKKDIRTIEVILRENLEDLKRALSDHQLSNVIVDKSNFENRLHIHEKNEPFMGYPNKASLADDLLFYINRLNVLLYNHYQNNHIS